MKKLSLLLLVIIFLVSCSAVESKDGGSDTSLKEVYPDLVMTNTSCSVGQSDSGAIVLTAGKMTLYSADNYALLKDFSFVSYDKDGVTETEGTAESGVIELDGSSITLKGNVSFLRPSDNISITAESLVYDKSRDEITTNGKVVVISDEGTIEGYDFRGDLKERIYSFSRISEGDFTLE